MLSMNCLRPSEKRHDQRHDDHDRRGHDDAPLGPRLGVGEVDDARRRREHPRAARDHEGPEEIVPVGDDAEDRKRPDCRTDQGQEDPQHHLQQRAAVDAGGVKELAGYLQEVLPQQEDRHRRADKGQDQPGVGVDQLEPRDDQERRHGGDVPRKDEGGQHEGEQQPPARKLQSRQRVGRRYAREDLAKSVNDVTITPLIRKRGIRELRKTST